MKKFTLLLISIFITQWLQAQCAIQELSLTERTTEATYIFEGKVIHQEAMWNDTQSKIWTRHTIQVFKKFKGNTGKVVYLLTPGGVVEGMGMLVTPSLQLQNGDIGLFFSDLTKFTAPEAGEMLHLKPFASLQGFIRYDLDKQQATDHFKKYENIPTQLYSRITNQLGKAYTELKPLPQTSAQKQLMPQVSTITPLTVTAGTFETITITGSGFGTQTGSATVRFRNPDFFGLSVAYQSVPDDHIISWSDTQIEVIVPGRDIGIGSSGAGSGAVRVVTSDGVFGQSADAITVLYNKVTLGMREVDLVNDNGNGGYTMTYHTDMFNNLPAREAVERGLINWRCAALSNFQTAASPTSTDCPSNDGVNIIAFDSSCSLDVGLLAQSTQWYLACGNGDAFFEEMDILFDADVAWNFGPTATGVGMKDFESIVTHELGHVHGMGHVLDYGNLMYPSLASATDIRTIDTDAETCANAIMAHSVVDNACAGSSAMMALSTCGGVVVNVEVFLEGAYDAVTEQMVTFLKDSDLVPLNQPYNRPPWNYTGTESVVSIPDNVVDWLLIEVRDESYNVLKSQAAFLRSDGRILDLDGSEGVYFPSILGNQNYHIAVRHRNHLAIVSDITTNLPNLQPLLLTDVDNVKGNAIQVQSLAPNLYAMRAGDFDSDGVVTVSDFNFYTTQTAQINFYLDGDCNLDKSVTVADFNFYQPNTSVIGVTEIRY